MPSKKHVVIDWVDLSVLEPQSLLAKTVFWGHSEGG